MPNRKTFDANDRYDHSSHSTREREQGDLQATPSETAASPKRRHSKIRHAHAPASPSQERQSVGLANSGEVPRAADELDDS